VSTARSTLFLITGILFGLFVLLAFRLSRETGKSVAASFLDVPAELQRLLTGLPGRAEEALSVGRQAYDAKRAEIDEFLHAPVQST
jgi:hypothetical protein